MLLLPTLLIVVWESIYRRVSIAHRAGSRSRREWRGICGSNLRRSFECTANKLVEHKLTRNPLEEGSAHISLFIKAVYQFEKRFACILRATRCIQGITQTLAKRDVEIIEFPSGYLSESVSDFDTLQYTHEEGYQ